MARSLPTFAGLLAFALTACGEIKLYEPRALPGVDDPSWKNPPSAGRNPEAHRVGDVWSRLTPNETRALALSTIEQEWLDRIGAFRHATTYFLGEFSGHSYALTNRHVVSDEEDCTGSPISFPRLRQNAICARLLGSWQNIDASLIEIRWEAGFGAPSLPALRLPVPPVFESGIPLATSGFGVAGQFTSAIPQTLSRDDDCRLFSPSTAPEPAGENAVQSFVLGCDVSPGDSGSPVWKRVTGEWVGMVWAGVVPKPALAQHSLSLADWLAEPAAHHAEIWESLNFGISTFALRRAWEPLPSLPSTSAELKAALEALLGP